MASPAQIHANRLNALRSTGPRTDEGKAASRFNALKYGIEARSLVLPGEDPAALEALALDYHRQFNPAGPLEDYLVWTIVQADWNRRRYTRVEAQILQAQPATLDAFTCPAARQVFRRLAAEERSLFRALKELRRVQCDRSAEEDNPQSSAEQSGILHAGCLSAPLAASLKPPAQPASPTDLSSASSEAPRIGFVPPSPQPSPPRPSKPPVSPRRGMYRRY